MAAPLTILLVEDHPGDVRLVEEAFAESDLHIDLHAVTDGEAALEFIDRDGEYVNAPRPDVAFLDLVMPAPDGEDLLHAIKHHPELGHVPVIILTGMDEEYVESQDLDHDADEDGVLQKPFDIEEFRDLLAEFEGVALPIARAGD
ncbi:response regulator [Halobacterium wangiae]|uniref:response regulator n=1 Tax=Halobacterium wangiae TaxID=2902623 RepID=UPI001E41BF51|nr:response regulator [Halobacterium wangiae]